MTTMALLYHLFLAAIQIKLHSNNTVGSAFIGFILNKVPQDTCMASSGLKAYACQIGQISNSPDTRRLVFKSFMFADSQQAVSLRFGKDGDDRTAYLSDSYISAISSPGFTQCYGANATDCTHNYAVKMLAVTEINQELVLLSPAFLGWFGGCGDLLCEIGNKTQNCRYIAQMNSHHCLREDKKTSLQVIEPKLFGQYIYNTMVDYGIQQLMDLNNGNGRVRSSQIIAQVDLFQQYSQIKHII